MKTVGIRSFSGPYFPAFELNTERYSEKLRIIDAFYAVNVYQTFMIILDVYSSFAVPLFDETCVNLYAADIQNSYLEKVVE